MDAGRRETRSPSLLGRMLRTLFWALFTAFVIGFVIGTLLRREAEKPIRYIGRTTPAEAIGSTLASHPGHVGHARPCVLVAGDHEEQV
jgi:hypothetical protein